MRVGGRAIYNDLRGATFPMPSAELISVARFTSDFPVLQLHAESVGNAVDEGEVGDDRGEVVNPSVVETGGAKVFNQPRVHEPRRETQYLRVRQRRTFGRRERLIQYVFAGQPAETIVLARLRYALRTQNLTEPRSVVVQSIPAVVERRYANGQHLAQPVRHRPRIVHHRTVQPVVIAHHGGMTGVDLDDVVGVRDAVCLT